jgi:hypothetical protein
MDFTETQREIIVNAYLLALEGKGQVIEDWAYPDAHELAEQGWLQRRFQPDGELSWWWTSQAETALDLNALVSNQSQN